MGLLYALIVSLLGMVLGTDNQEKEVPHAGLPPMAPELPDASFPYPKVPPYLGAPPPQKPTQICPLVETGGEFRPTRVLKPFSLLELKTWEAIWMTQANI